MNPALTATVVTGGVGILAICAAKFKCLVHCSSCCHVESFKFGVLDNAIVDNHEVEVRKINANGNDLIYVSKNQLTLMLTMMTNIIRLYHQNLYQLMKIAGTDKFKHILKLIYIK